MSDSEFGGMAECAQYLRHISQFNYYIYQIFMRHDSTQSTKKSSFNLKRRLAGPLNKLQN